VIEKMKTGISMKSLRRKLVLTLATLGAVFVPSISRAQDDKPTLYCVGYAHLDTQWRWSYPQVISEFLRNTLHDNFKLFDKYPHYVFNFTGANRYMLFKEYFPEDYQKLKKCIADGRWFPGGSSMEEGDVNMPDGEALIRQVMYGNQYFRREFGKDSSEYMLPDCFGFQATLPSILAHCGLKGFSTQKLTWGSAVGIPFNVGVWEGPDGRQVVAALNCTAYTSPVNDDLTNDRHWIQRLNDDKTRCGVAIDYRYYGAGDRGGAPNEKSVANMEKSVDGTGPLKAVSATSEQMFNDLTPDQISKLPRYRGDLLLTGHSTGELSSEAFMKRSERKIENLADAAEHASVIADWLGSAAYPMPRINEAWRRMLSNQFHDTMAGTALPAAYEFAWNDEFLSMNQFASVTQDGVGAVARALDTRSDGVPIVIYNPLSVDREDVADITVTVPDTLKNFVVLDAQGKGVPAQIVSHEGNQLHLLILAKVPSVGMSVYQIKPGTDQSSGSLLITTENSLENSRFKVTLNSDGDIASIYDKIAKRQTLSAPARIAFLYENPAAYPAWNMDYADRSRAPDAYLSGPAKVRIVETGQVRVAIEVERQAMGSVVRQQIRLSSGAAGDRVEVATTVDWQTREHSLEAIFPLVAGNPDATYESQSAAVQRGNNNEKKFEVPQQQWLDLTDSSGNFGTSILNDCKYGSDKPDDHTIRLTLMYTPGTRAGYQDQGSQDFGHHQMIYAIAPHSSSWQQAGTAGMARRLNQPLLGFQTTAHAGPLGRSFSFCKVDSDHVSTMAIKKAEDSDEVIVRLHETNGQAAEGVNISFAAPVVSAREVDGQEREIGKATITNGKLSVDMKPFIIRAFAVKLAPAPAALTRPQSYPVQLAYDMDAVSTHENLSDGSFDPQGHTYAAEAFPESIVSDGITFNMGPAADGKKNAVICKGQTIDLPGNCNKVYILAAAVNGDVPADFSIDGKATSLNVQDWSAPIGCWDDRQWAGMVPGLTYNWTNRLVGLVPGFSKRAELAWYSSHRHDPQAGNEYYKFTYIFKYGIDLPAGAKQLALPNNDRVRVFAVTAANNPNDMVQPMQPLYDMLANQSPASIPTFSPSAGSFKDSIYVTINHPLYYTEHGLHYTTDGSEPTAESPVYTQPIFISQKTTLKAKEIDKTGAGPTASIDVDVNDVTPPTVLKATGSASMSTMLVKFNEPLRKDQAENPANYQLTPKVEIDSAELNADGTGVLLKLATHPGDGDYQITVKGVGDASPNNNKIAAASIAVDMGKPIFTLDSYSAGDPKMQKVTGLPIKGNDPWTINMYVKPTSDLEDRTIIAGFGLNSDKGDVGHGRYISKFSTGLHFWARNDDAESTTAIERDKWQMLTATYDGKTLRLFRNGKLVGHQNLELQNDEAVVEIAPLDPWDHARRFQGEIRRMTIWNTALPTETLKIFAESMPN
jgi:alpha-mannosidase